MCIARAGQLFLEVMQTEAVMDALLQDTAEFAKYLHKTRRCIKWMYII